VKNPFFIEQTVDPLLCFNFDFIKVKNNFLLNVSCALKERIFSEGKLYPATNGKFGDFKIKYESDEDEDEKCEDVYDKFINIVMPDEEHILITVCQDVSYHIKLEWICINAYN